MLTTHYLEEAERLCDRVVTLRDGALSAAQRRDEWAATTGQRALQITLRDPLDAVPEAIAAAVTSQQGRELVVRCDDDRLDVGVIVSALTAAGARVVSVEARRATLEDLFTAPSAKATP